MSDEPMNELAIFRCPEHRDNWMVSIETETTGVRVLGVKCCGRWEYHRGFALSVDKINELIRVLEDAREDLDKEPQ